MTYFSITLLLMTLSLSLSLSTQGGDLLVSCYYIDCDLNAYAISPAQVSELDRRPLNIYGWCRHACHL